MRAEIKYLEIAEQKKMKVKIPPLAKSLGIDNDRALKLTAMIDIHGKSVKNNALKLTASGYMAIAKQVLSLDGPHNCGNAAGLAIIGDCSPEQAQQVIDDILAFVEAQG